jgi:hypothetical protein
MSCKSKTSIFISSYYSRFYNCYVVGYKLNLLKAMPYMGRMVHSHGTKVIGWRRVASLFLGDDKFIHFCRAFPLLLTAQDLALMGEHDGEPPHSESAVGIFTIVWVNWKSFLLSPVAFSLEHVWMCMAKSWTLSYDFFLLFLRTRSFSCASVSRWAELWKGLW